MSDKNDNAGNRNAGYRNDGDRNAGSSNAGDRNAGYRNDGDWNAGDWNDGDRNAGYRNAGGSNAGDWNAGNRNAGDWNVGDRNAGYLNTGTPKIRIFNKITDIDIENIVFPEFFYFNSTEWILDNDMTDKEKDSYPSYVTTGGYLKCYEYKQSFKKSYEDADQEDREKVKKLPNFDADIFYEISGIRINGKAVKELTLQDVADKFNIPVDELRIKD